MPRRRKAVSEIIASLMLLFIVSALGTVLYSYTLTITQGQHDELTSEMSRAAERAQERVRVIAVWWSGTGGLLNVTVLNYGRSEVEVADVYVDGERVSVYSFGKNEVIHTQEWGRVAFTSPRPITSGSIYEIRVVSENGVPSVYQWES